MSKEVQITKPVAIAIEIALVVLSIPVIYGLYFIVPRALFGGG